MLAACVRVVLGKGKKWGIDRRVEGVKIIIGVGSFLRLTTRDTDGLNLEPGVMELTARQWVVKGARHGHGYDRGRDGRSRG